MYIFFLRNLDKSLSFVYSIILVISNKGRANEKRIKM